ncbi:hypothetical protein L202_01688 [Cryptococcus amylolentus CBS 6039]|uniref:2,3-diketo-5-methylthio-1-phosphopentane phosphatase n=3 Tax=Cryptococcus amylolentus TaxID=104669 RepID=A0A1E3I4X8_9TREE|nr:hypothetical protein L202_01688 [Cryptococcus amylolentus CBS 6039]ODN83568.1 hypothetical protein L202_01688 [Cryptococcus amylolentus CBS 6039]ODO11064.1 hypothetical protein I350_01666 [Cryptococcus amylolentus CBS 6273]
MSTEEIPKSVLPYPPIHKDAQFVVLSDWDGTITDRDSNDLLVDNLGFGFEKRRALNIECLEDRICFRDTFKEMLESIDKPFEECKEYLKQHIKLDPGFEKFYKYCRANGIPVVIVSSGMEANIRAVLSTLLPGPEAEEIEIIANDVKFTDPEGKGDKWEIVFRHPTSGFGHDKSRAILPYRDLPHRPTLFFCGDGVSDLSAAKHADLLFAKTMPSGHSDLQTFCQKQKINHLPFVDFNKVLEKLQEVVAGKTVDDILTEEGKKY